MAEKVGVGEWKWQSENEKGVKSDRGTERGGEITTFFSYFPSVAPKNGMIRSFKNYSIQPVNDKKNKDKQDC